MLPMKYRLALALGLALSNIAAAQEGGWKDPNGRPIAETEARRSMNGLGGSLVVTPDADWREKWNTPADTVPHFNEAGLVARGQSLFVLIFFANPALDKNGRADLRCDLQLIRPDGSVSTNERDIVCYQGEIKGRPFSTYLAAPVIGFIGDAADPVGTWTVRVSLKDKLRNTVLPLKTSFVLK
jgi:hypothetical protein